MNVLVTGSAGFIGFHLTRKLLDSGLNVVGIDNLNKYYDSKLKIDRLNILRKYPNFKFYKISICNFNKLNDIFNNLKPAIIIHLAAQAGVRYSIKNPRAYISSNLVGFGNIIELAKKYDVQKFIYASSSSVYGNSDIVPFSEKNETSQPISLYAATKKCNEVVAHSYSHLYGLNTIGLRFFTVYGPWGRPDMAYFSFTKNIINGKPINIFNNGNLFRDFTYIDDVVKAITGIALKDLSKIMKKHHNYLILNVGNNKPVKLDNFVKLIEKFLGKKAKKNLLPMQPGDVDTTYADISKIYDLLTFKPRTSIKKGLKEFINWYRDYFKE